jgi:hypothetical protein
MVCTPDSTLACECSTGVAGTETCNSAGTGYGACTNCMVCSPGSTASCACSGGNTGTEVCNSAGTGYGTCGCDGCDVLAGCVGNCATQACATACADEATSEAITLYNAAADCVAGACPNTTGGVCATDSAACVQCEDDSEGAGGACYSQIVACIDN